METVRNDSDHYTCQKNGCDLRGAPIPEKYREMHGGATHYSEVIGIYDRDLDRTTEWLCPKCQARWPR